MKMSIYADAKQVIVYLPWKNVLAANASYQGEFSEKVSLQAGLRGEYSDNWRQTRGLNRWNTQNFSNLFQVQFIQHKVSETTRIVIYSKSSNHTRPNYRPCLNPFVSYIDPFDFWSRQPKSKHKYLD